MAAAKTPKRRPSKFQRAAQRLKRNQARLSALNPTDPEGDIDAFRRAMSRRISMFIGNSRRLWRGCPEPFCRRARACIAASGNCSNAPPLPPDPDGTRDARARASMYHALQAAAARLPAQEAASAAPPRVPSSRRGRQRGSA
jgi:hypothetical protein